MCGMNKIELLSPEFKNAVYVVGSILCDPIAATTKIPKEIIYENSVAVVSDPLKSREIPSGKNWRWNQVKARKRVALQKNQILYNVEFCKLMPRAIKSELPIPRNIRGMKMWKFVISDNYNSEVKYHVLWCQKGMKRLVIEDFRFLSPLMDPELAEELWPSV